MDFRFLTLFPEIFDTVLSSSLLGKARERGLISTQVIQIRDFATDRHRTVDDTPYGGGEGMLLKADVLHAAWKKALPRKPAAGKKVLTVLLSPQGEVFTQSLAKELAGYSKIVFVCGHYEGVDERFIELCVDREVSIGDYVLTGGELPALVMADAISRLVPGVVGKMASVEKDSLEGGLLKYPQYTRPREFQGREVPPVLLSGDHKKIARWREEQMIERTRRKRPDLLKG
ncbi:MAG: tRNA (guanosine(37)-N1)-methyltransferase TrmD [Bdellovibrionota bacterium]